MIFAYELSEWRQGILFDSLEEGNESAFMVDTKNGIAVVQAVLSRCYTTH